MTNAELIKALKDAEGYIIYVAPNCVASCEAIKAIRSAADEIEAISKTVIPHRNYENLNLYWCDCGWFLRNMDKTPNYCPNCGKRIEWENAE